ncbi:MAG TPA: HEPN domain-containing protein [Rhizomicrobium sp.]|jgi:uncharacterized protein (UPF0332 family)|nr:HEPN domain-containing protein [Rhizomicrobium sp.]
MTPEAERFLAKADDLLVRAGTMLNVGLFEDAGREAYLAGFHAAQALLFERTGKSAKTHKGVQAEFLRLTRGAGHLDDGLRSFLSTAYNLKSIADYETGTGSSVSPERASAAVAEAGRFAASIRALIDVSDS